MKKTLLSFALIFGSLFVFSQQGMWEPQATGFVPPLSGAAQIYAIDSNVVWIIAYDGDPNSGGLPRNEYSRTIDGGAHWSYNEVPATAGTHNWASMAAIDANKVWALLYDTSLGNGGVIWNTVDAGFNWTQQGASTFISNQSLPANIYFWTDSIGFVMGNQVNGEFECYTTIDGGTNWLPLIGADIPDPQDLNENPLRTHMQAIGDTIWFDTNEGRIYRSTDRGLHWTAANTNLTSGTASINFCFTSGSYGIARLYNDTTLLNTTVKTTDGGLTWNPISTAGNLFGGDIKRVPGSPLTMISTGNSSYSNYIGTSFTTNGGLNWITIETGIRRGSLGIINSSTMWCGGFTASPSADGVYKWTNYPKVICTDPSITPGIVSANKYDLCMADTLKMTVTGAIGPEDGYYSGIGWVISTSDISGSTNPLGEPSLAATQRAAMPTAHSNTQLFINDGTLIDGINLQYGIYFWTPVFFGNATNADSTRPVLNLGDLHLDPNCTYSGASTSIHVFAPGDTLCGVGISEIYQAHLSIKSYLLDNTSLNITINSEMNGKASIYLLDLTGRIVETIEVKINSGINNEIINTDGLAAGTYLVKAEVNSYHASNKIVKY